MIEFKDVSFSYSKPIKKEALCWALEHVSFSVKKGQIYGVAGHTGSGKSTLAQIACGLMAPTSGSVVFDGYDLAQRTNRDISGAIGMVFQYPENQLFGSTVEDEIAFGPRNMKLPKDEIKRRVSHSLSQVGFDFASISQLNPFQLSGGQQRRIALAGVLAMQPSLLIMDEPTAGLDPQAKREFLMLVKSLNAQGTTIMMISHDMNDLAKLCHEIIVLKQGKVFSLGCPSSVFSNPEKLEEIGLEAPRTSTFITKLHQAGLSLPDANTIFDCDALADAIAQLLN